MRGATIAVLVVIATVLAGTGFAIVTELANLKAEIAATRREMAATKERLTVIERRAEQAALDQARTARSEQAATFEERAAQAFALTREETQLVKDFIKVPPVPAGRTPTIALGSNIPPGALMPLPSQVSEKFPRLDGARFLIDPAGAIVIVRRGSRRADAIIPPN